MIIVALDTSTEACSAALQGRDGEIFAEFELAPRQHNRLLPAMLERLLEAAGLERAEITHCAFANGPGAFTGIRIAAAQAQGIGLALGMAMAFGLTRVIGLLMYDVDPQDPTVFGAVFLTIVMVGMAVLMGGVQGGGMKSLSRRFDERSLVLAGSAVLAVSLAAVPSAGTFAILLVPLAFASLGRAVIQPSLLSLTSSAASPSERGAVLGVFQSSESSGGKQHIKARD